MEVGIVRSIDIDHEMQQAYLDYAMSVIVARALPDARDGLKPVHRRILYSMFDMGLRPDSMFKKSARIVGEVMGKYHPHGDQAVYDAMARFAQDFSMRYLLVEGQGNFGSVDGDPPAAMRYTEARLTEPSMQMLADIQRNTVNFSPNFDGTLSEPDVLPSALPNLLVNGATGIAVGMSTSIPPHNLVEVVGALRYMLDHWENLEDINVEDLMHFIIGPDFPTGGIIVQAEQDEEGLHAAYGAGRGKVTVQAKAHIEEMGRGRNRIIVTELPYMTNKSSLIERIAELVRDERLEGIVDLRDESDRQGLRIMIELNKTADPQQVLSDLYKSTPMRSTFGIIMLALVDGEPRLLSLKQALRVYLDHRLEVVKRRSEFELEKARARAHILEGLRVALKNLDEVIDLIRKAPDVETARTRLMKRFRLSEIQAQSILDMQLRRLAALERKKIEDEYKEVLALIKELEALLKSPKRMRTQVSDELEKVKEAYGDRRRTQIVRMNGKGMHEMALVAGELTPERSVWVTVTAEGLISRTIEDAVPVLTGKEAPTHAFKASTRDTLFLVTEQGEAAGVPVHALPEAASPSNGIPFHRASALQDTDKLAVLFTLKPKEERPENEFVLTISRQGMLKKTASSELPGPTAHTFTLMKMNEGDQFAWVCLTDGTKRILLATENGMAIQFSEEEVRPMGMVAGGVGGIKLQEGDHLVSTGVPMEGGEALLAASDGKAKRVPLDQFPMQGRYGQGVAAWKLIKGARLVGLVILPKAKSKSAFPKVIFKLEKLAPKVVRADEIALQTRAAAGKTVVDVKAGDRVTAIDVLPAEIGGAEKPKAPASKPPDGSQPEKPAGKVTSTKRAAKIAAEPKTDGRKPAVKKIISKKETASKPVEVKAKKPAPSAPAKIKTTAADPGLTLFDLDEVSPIKAVKAKPTDGKSASPQKVNKDTKTNISAKKNAKSASKARPASKPSAVKKTAPKNKKANKAVPDAGVKSAARKKIQAEKPVSKTSTVGHAGKKPTKPSTKSTLKKAVPKPASKKNTTKK